MSPTVDNHGCCLPRGRRRSRGAALVEMAIVLVLLMMIVMGIIEFGFMFRGYMALNEVARSGCRSAALGSSTSVVTDRINQSASALDLQMAHITAVSLDFRTYDKANGTWSGWQTLGDAESGNNNAPCNMTLDSQVRVRVTYQYPLITGTYFASMIGENGNVSLTGTCVMRREETL